MALVDVVCHQLADVFQIVAGGKNAVETHLFELRFNVGKVMLSDHQIAADVKENVADTAFDAALAQSQAIDIAVVSKSTTRRWHPHQFRWRHQYIHPG